MDKIRNNTASSVVIGNHTLTANQINEFIFAHYDHEARGLIVELVTDGTISFLDRAELVVYTFDIAEYNRMLNFIEFTQVTPYVDFLATKSTHEAFRLKWRKKELENIVGSSSDTVIRDSDMISEGNKQFYKIGKAVV